MTVIYLRTVLTISCHCFFLYPLKTRGFRAFRGIERDGRMKWFNYFPFFISVTHLFIYFQFFYGWQIFWFTTIVRKGVSTSPPPPMSKSFPSLLGSLHFLKFPIPTLPANQSFQVFLINRNATVKLSSITTIHLKQQHNICFFIFKFTLKYILGNVYINKVHARQYLQICLYCREGFSHPFSFFVVSKGSLYV